MEKRKAKKQEIEKIGIWPYNKKAKRSEIAHYH